MPEWPLPFWLKATALNSSEQPVAIVSVAISSYMHTAEGPEEPEEEPEPPIFLRDLPLDLDPLVALDCRSNSISVREEGLWRYRSLSEETHTHVVGFRIAVLRAHWSATGRELHRNSVSEIKRSVV